MPITQPATPSTRPSKIARVTSGVAAVAVLGWAIALGGPVTLFVDPLSLLAVGTLTTALLVANHGFSGIFASVQTLMSGGSAAQISGSTAIFIHSAALSVASGSGLALVGMVHMLQSMDDPSAIGPAVAVAILAPLYGLAAAILFLSCAGALARQVPSPPAGPATP